MTQRLALFRMVSERRKLTTVHDVSAAWTGIGAAIYVLWQQRQVTSSVLEITVVVTYLTSMLFLHIGSSSIVQWQLFNSTPVDILISDLALPGNAVNVSQLQWEEIFPVLQSISLDAGMPTYGLSNNTLYDMPRVPTVNGSFLEASVNATTLGVQCGLVPNLTTGMTPFGTGVSQSHFVNFSLGGIDKGSFVVSPTWKDFVRLVSPYSQCAMCPQTIFYMITTGIDVDDAARDAVAVNLSWTYVPESGGHPQNSTILTHIAACSVSAQTVPAMLDLQENQLVSTMGQTASSSNTSWSTWSPGDAIDFSVGMATAMNSISLGVTETTVDMPDDYFFTYTTFDAYMMNFLGIDVASVVAAAGSNSSANHSVMLTPSQFENAVAQTTTKLLWISGQLGESAGGFQRTVGESRATTNALQWRLNLNPIPVIFASAASFTALILVPFIIGRKPFQQHSQWISGTSVLECLWLGAQSEALDSRLTAIEEPRSDRLRAARMFDTCLGDTGRSSLNVHSRG
ncbi:hypothetical protein L210DRAFT_3524554 [Boletus edulis BED1]|uniref:Transmembrane protein n=1 Tax=Boletus edulis BED1 TaxID=1328754 RepID=A0AAD4C6W4_BOLED|nr:hypothetical protein L210DRAFT_3524554 [Boletus edulis BED1]